MKRVFRQKGRDSLHRFLSYLTVAVLSAHCVLGCCWHHAHVCEHEQGTMVALCHGGHADDHSCPANEQQHHPANCTKAKCVFVRSTNVRVGHDTGFSVSWVDAPILVGNLSSLTPVLPSGWQWACRPPLPPVRLHLTHQVLLI